MRVESVALSAGEIVLTVTDPAFRIDPAVLRRMVTEGGATLRGLTLEGCGTLGESDGAWTWRMTGSGQEIPVSFEPMALAQQAREATGGKWHVSTSRIEIPESGEIPLRPLLTGIERVTIE